MFLLKNISHSDYLKKYLSIFLLLFFMNNFLASKSEENLNLTGISNEENKLEEFFSKNSISYSQYDKAGSQLKLVFGYNLEPPNNSYYPDLSIINYSDSLREMYLHKLNDMT